MYRFKLTPASAPDSAVEFESVDASSALILAGRLQLGQADLSCDGVYLCTIRSNGSDQGGFWIVDRQRGARPTLGTSWTTTAAPELKIAKGS